MQVVLRSGATWAALAVANWWMYRRPRFRLLREADYNYPTLNECSNRVHIGTLFQLELWSGDPRYKEIGLPHPYEGVRPRVLWVKRHHSGIRLFSRDKVY